MQIYVPNPEGQGSPFELENQEKTVIGYNNHFFSHLYQHTGRYGNEVTCRPPTVI